MVASVNMSVERGQPLGGGSGSVQVGMPEQPGDDLLAESILATQERYVGAKLAHDYNNVFQVLSGYLWLIDSAQSQDDAQNGYMTLMREALDRGNNLTKQQSSLFRPVTPTPIGLNELLRKCEPFFSRLLRADVTIDIDCAAEVDAFLVDQKNARLLFIGLVAYAINATTGRTTLRIGTERAADSERALIRVTASGTAVVDPSEPGAIRDRKALLWACFVQAERGQGKLSVQKTSNRIELELELASFKRPR